MTGFDLRVRIGDGVATVEVYHADGTPDYYLVVPVDGDFDSFMALFMTISANMRSNWLGCLHAWTSAWPDAAKQEGIDMLEKLAKGLSAGGEAL